MKLIEFPAPDFSFTDERGTITQLCHGGYSQINAVFTKKGAVRGNMHYHRDNTEAFFIISGKAEVTVKYGDKSETYIFNAGDMFRIPPLIRHDFKYLEDTCLVGLYDGCVENPDGTKDIYTDEEG